ncbi:LytTr DNA-binding domain-containing protein [Breznakibacter xylanolyticus]|uniref:LytTr DNA-binding domain-containing protein n=1 Tax=Breznakibacter xylanolyticus TaxID=990 RepID=A0A2W7P226_9BACT|nr:LytTR family DNA-binding domain-containing protein [Breznakibacter xylanolyticus]PZX19486.1 LytTr DNA-binding domain-containing protein [Breznakibacter xylanolyticus]
MDLSQKLPSYLTEKKNITRLILFTAAFALVFVNIYAPFGIRTFLRINPNWEKLGLMGFLSGNKERELIFMSSAIILTGVLVVVISRMIMYSKVKKGAQLSTLHYIQWVGVEILSMALFYTFYEYFFVPEPRPVLLAFRKSLLNTTLVLIIPYGLMWLYLSWRDKDKQLQALTQQPDPTTTNLMVPFKDDKGTLRISLKTNDLLYLQGSDNYVTIYYHTPNKPSKFLLRNTLKKLEDEFSEKSIVRCHRSYMVNIDKVKLVRKDKDGLILELDTTPPIEIPVSKTYMQDIMQAFGHL